MKTLLIISYFVICLISSCTTPGKSVGDYEFTQVVKLNEHWNGYTSIKIDFETKKQFNLQIIDGANYGAFPITDTILISGYYTQNNGKLILHDSVNHVNRFSLQRRKNKIIIIGTYFDPKKNVVNKVKNINIMK